MRKGKNVIGQDVFGISDGLRVDSVKDLLLEDGEDGVVALLVSEGGLLGSSRVVPFASVVRFGRSAVLIDAASSVVPAADDPRVAEILNQRHSLLGSRVITDDGEDLGTISDLYFDESSGRISGYEVSGGVIGDAMHGTSYLPFDHIRTIGGDVVIARAEAAQLLQSQEGGLTSTVEDLRSSLAERLPSMPDEEQSDPDDLVTHDPDGSLVGAKAQHDLFDADGSVVIANGQAISLELVQRARSEGNLDALYGSVGRSRPVPVGEQASEAVSTAVDTASDIWNRFTSRLSEMTDAAGQRMDTQQTRSRLDHINDSIGRPVTKVILDRDDSVILDLGDLVTHQAIQRAADAGLLESLLDSVFHASDVTFSRDEMRAEIAGDSTVEKSSGGAHIISELETRLEGQGQPRHGSAEDTVGSHEVAQASDDGGFEDTAVSGSDTSGGGAHSSEQMKSAEDIPTESGQTIGQRPDGQDGGS